MFLSLVCDIPSALYTGNSCGDRLAQSSRVPDNLQLKGLPNAVSQDLNGTVTGKSVNHLYQYV